MSETQMISCLISHTPQSRQKLARSEWHVNVTQLQHKKHLKIKLCCSCGFVSRWKISDRGAGTGVCFGLRVSSYRWCFNHLLGHGDTLQTLNKCFFPLSEVRFLKNCSCNESVWELLTRGKQKKQVTFLQRSVSLTSSHPYFPLI